MIIIPSQKRIIPVSQPNIGDSQGSFFASLNIDPISNRGKVRGSPRLLLNVNSTTLANLGIPSAFAFNPQAVSDIAYVWCAAGARVFYSTLGPETQFKQDATSGTPTSGNSDTTDICMAYNEMFVSQSSTTMKYLASAVWNSFTCGNGGGIAQMVKFGSRVYKIDNNGKDIISFDSAHTVASAGTQYTLQSLCDGTNNIIAWIAASSSRIYVGTISFTGVPGIVYGWDGSQTTVNETYTLQDQGALSGTILGNAPWIFDVSGRLQEFNGGDFVERAKLPLQRKFLGSHFTSPTNRPVHFNGMKVIDGRIRININTKLWDTGTTAQDNMPAGVWEYDKEIGLYHLESPGLATSSDTITDYGQQKISAIGAISDMKAPHQSFTAGSTNGRMMAGYQYYTDATTTKNGIFYDDNNDTKQKAVEFVTSKIYSAAIDDAWDKVWVRFRKLLDSSDKIVVKYRTEEVASIEQTITWVTSTVFSTTLNTGIAVGDEVEVVNGIGASKPTVITAIEVSGSTYFITVEDTFTGISGSETGVARFQKWKKLIAISDQLRTSAEPTIGPSSNWVQFKVWGLFTGRDEIESLTLSNNIHKKP
jgi:hypothetical protein